MRYNTSATHLAEETLQKKGVYGPASFFERSLGVVTAYFDKGTYPIAYYIQVLSVLLDAGWEMQKEIIFGEPVAYEEFLIQPVRYIEFKRPQR